jgi:glycolate oxidase iron-sulfur subunit
MDHVSASGVSAVVASNPGCTMQLAYGARRRGIDLKLLHVVDLLDRAYGNGA